MVRAERVGFEPTNPCGSMVFKTIAFVHSATVPARILGSEGTPTYWRRDRWAASQASASRHLTSASRRTDGPWSPAAG
jgi:hypothetical protein